MPSIRKLPIASTLVFALFVLFLARDVPADVAAGQQAFDAGDYAMALTQWRVDAAQGNGRALFNIGRMYEQGSGVRADPYTSFVLYRVAFQQGHKQGEAAANRVGGALPGGDLSRGVMESERLVREGRFLPNLPGASMSAAPPPQEPPPAQKPVPAPAPVPAKQAAPAPAPVTATANAPPPVAAAPATAAIASGRLYDLKYSCAMQLRWQDKGSGGHDNLALFEPMPEPGYFVLGGYAQGNYDTPYGCIASIKPLGAEAAQMFAPPQRFERVWKDKGTGATMDGSIWRAIPPSDEYVCLGHVGQIGKEMPAPAQYRCVKRCLTVAMTPTNPMWTSEGTGAKSAIVVYSLPHINSFIAAQGGQQLTQIEDLNPHGECRQ